MVLLMSLVSGGSVTSASDIGRHPQKIVCCIKWGASSVAPLLTILGIPQVLYIFISASLGNRG
jgi:hypothetical protein